MTDLLAEMAKVRAENPAWPDEVVAKFARVRLAAAEQGQTKVIVGEDSEAGRLAAELLSMTIARIPWWRRLLWPKLWPLLRFMWLAKRQARRRG